MWRARPSSQNQRHQGSAAICPAECLNRHRSRCRWHLMRRMPVKAVVVYKWARNAADAIVRTDGSIPWRNARRPRGEDGPAAVAAAQQIAADTGGAVIGLTMGDGD